MLADQSTQLSLSQLFNALPDGVLYFRAVRDGTNGHIIDFVIDYANPAVSENTQGRYQSTVGTSVRHDNRHDTLTTERVFAQLKAVVETEESGEYEYYSQILDEWLCISRAKAGDGVITTTRIITASKQASLENERRSGENERQANFLNNVLDASSNGIVAERAVRDAQGAIVDFLILSANRQAAGIVNSTVDALVGQSDLEQHPDPRSSELFGAYVKTVETGEPQFVETYYNDGRLDHWVNVSTRKLADDELVITFANVSDIKQTQQALEQARSELQRVIDTSQTGIFVFSPVYDASGNLTDFRFKTINRMVAALVGQTPAVITGALASDWFVSYRDTPMFDHYKRTVETGEDRRFDINYTVDGFDVWFDVKSVKFGDSVLVTFTNYTELKQAQINVEQQAGLLSSVLDSSNSGIIAFESIRDERGAITDFHFATVNEACERILGVPVATMRGNKLLTLFPGNVETGLFARYVNTTETGEPMRTETYYNRDGLDSWLDISAQKLNDGFVVTFTDISVAKRAQQTVESQSDLLNSILNGSINGIMAFESIRDRIDGPRVDGGRIDGSGGRIIDFTFLASNEASNRMVGKLAGELIGKPLLSVFPGNVESGLFDLYVNTVETGEPGRTEVYYKHDGLDFWLDISAQKLNDGFVVTFTDISVLKRAAKLVEQSATELQTVIDTSQTGIFLFSPIRDESSEVIDFRFRLANRMLAAYVGQEPEAVIGALGSQWFPDYKTNGLFDAYLKTYLTGEAQRFDIHYDGSGIDVWLDIMATKLGDEVLVTFGDYTSLKKLQQQLESSVVDLQRSNANLEQFAYVASHDLQEPLRKIQAFGDIIETQYGPVIGEQGADMIRRMQSAAARMQVLIKDVLAYSRIATKRDAIGPVDLEELVASVVDDLETAVADQKAMVTVDPMPTVTGDAGQLRQLFQNLLSNALKFTKPNQPLGQTPAPEQPAARITVTARTVKGRDAGITIPPGDADRLFHLIEIADNGIGFEPHQADRIFQVFQRLHSRSDYKGTGIGLAIVKKVVENHSGHIQAVGRPGEGATFRILLPA